MWTKLGFTLLWLVQSSSTQGVFPGAYQNYDYSNPTSTSKLSGGSSFFGGQNNLFYGQDASSFSPELSSTNGFDFSNQIPGSVPTGAGPNQFQPSIPLQPSGQSPYVPLEDPNMVRGCGRAPAVCAPSKYRSYDGSCNNLRNPIWGTPQTPYTRLLAPKYGDGLSAPTLAKSGRDLPLSRTVSLLLFPDVPIQDPKFTLAAMQYGQIITHDMSMIAGSTQSTPHNTQCCTDDGQLLQGVSIPEHCYPMVLPRDDPQTVKSNVKCMNFVRTLTDRDRNCVGGRQPAEQLTVVNHYLDLSIVYGNTDQVNQQVREFNGGRLRVVQRRGKEWPPQHSNITGTCPGAQSFEEPCYFAGDNRVNQNPQLTIFQIVLLREHNRIANALAALNPHWNDETIFQEARKINIAQHQHIVYYEWLPIFLGVSNSLRNKIIYDSKGGYVDDYSETVNPTIINEHSTSAFRFFHSLIVGFLDLISKERSVYGNLRLSDWFNRPAVLEQGNNFDDLTRGLTTQPESKSNQFFDSEITQFLFKNPGQMFGQDLRATDIHRNRDHGLASYNDFRVFCGLPKAYSFKDFLDAISPENIQKLSTIYEDPDDVDLTVGAALEKLVPGTLAGPVNLCILTEQFYRTRAGDRFFYENGAHNTGSGFTLGQLNEIRKASISRILCDNGNHITSMQPHGFERMSSKNVVVPCESLPAVDLSLWQEGNNVNTGQTPFGFSGPGHNYFLKK